MDRAQTTQWPGPSAVQSAWRLRPPSPLLSVSRLAEEYDSHLARRSKMCPPPSGGLSPLLELGARAKLQVPLSGSGTPCGVFLQVKAIAAGYEGLDLPLPVLPPLGLRARRPHQQSGLDTAWDPRERFMVGNRKSGEAEFRASHPAHAGGMARSTAPHLPGHSLPLASVPKASFLLVRALPLMPLSHCSPAFFIYPTSG